MSITVDLAQQPARVKDVIAKTLQECQNGLPGRVLVLPLPASPGLRDEIVKQVCEYAADAEAWMSERDAGIDLRVPLAAVTVEFTDANVVIAGHQTDAVPAPRPVGGSHAVTSADRLRETARWAAAAVRDGRAPDDATLGKLHELLDSASWLLASLASDALNRAGEPAVPRFVRDHDPHEALRVPGADRDFTAMWEDRIDVDEYALYEAVHPAYAAQTVEVASMIDRHLPGAPERILDVGSGPGLPTVMLSELFPDSAIDAVEPSVAAFPHLVANAAGHPITPHRCGVTDFPGRDAYPVVVSVGASHHLDTRLFFRALKRLVQPNGLVVVADELIGEFTTEQERARSVIDHHMSYIDEALGNVDESDLPPQEICRLRAFRSVDRHRPGAMHELLDLARLDRVAHSGTRGAWQRVRFAVLELEALVAGIDYDVERKTYLRNFVRLAEAEGLAVVEHRRVHATCGESAFDAGTHVVALCQTR